MTTDRLQYVWEWEGFNNQDEWDAARYEFNDILALVHKFQISLWTWNQRIKSPDLLCSQCGMPQNYFKKERKIILCDCCQDNIFILSELTKSGQYPKTKDAVAKYNEKILNKCQNSQNKN
jgi:hypothetical protein